MWGILAQVTGAVRFKNLIDQKLKNKKHIIIEILLILFVIIQSSVIYFLYDMSKDAFQCNEDMDKLFSYEENNNYDAIIELGNHLIKNGYENDKYVIRATALAYYKKDDKTKAIGLLNSYFEGNHSCEITRLRDNRYIYLDDATVHYILGKIYHECGLYEKSISEKEMAFYLAKFFYESKGKKFDEDLFIKVAELPFEDMK